MNVIKASNVDIGKVYVCETKGKKTKISYVAEDKELFSLKVQTGKMRIPWEANERKHDGKLINIEINASTYEMFDDENKSSVKAVRELLSSIEKLHPTASDNPSELNLSSVLYGKNPKFSPTIKMSVPIRDLKPDVNVFDKNGKKIDFENVNKGSICSFIVKVSHFWTSAKSYGLQLVIEQIMVFNDTMQRHMPIAVDSDDDSD
jgi:hypothetical protein